jgi:carbon monoxide dehydrogenase subunit G
MTQIKSKEVEITASNQQVFDYVNDLNNFENLLPADRIEDWKSDTDSCNFKIKGIATIGFRKKTANEPEYLQLESDSSAPFAFTINIHISALSDGTCKAHQIIEADINPFLKMMVEKPLTNLFDYIADRLQAIFAK